ncbi:helix-hairpin-helix domain-containing protein [Flavobacteriaceae bacterium S356]|uniref:Helix-hairpin-helix domain-containing protein n=1 Tax=Asprobacillus argus TaxID=3076534 RepID=A0ABU3LJT5_9FLAO|nr:helix-hairpin-helix domain-containing protein [Flavobacteriaceae bacterium S356]
MKKLRSHFWYNKNQRNGIFCLLLIIIVLQVVYVTIDFSGDTYDVNTKELALFEKQFDSLNELRLEKKKFKLYPFNPNYITDYKGYQLGMSIKEIDRLLAYRKIGKFVNSKKEFQQVTKISDSLLIEIAPYFKFPDWVVKRQAELEKGKHQFVKKEDILPHASDYVISSTDINEATIDDFQSINGVGETLSERILKYRNKLQGFTYNDQLFEVWNLKQETAQKILAVFKVKEKPLIKKINVNTASFKEVLAIPYIDYELCKKIFELRDEVAELQDIAELKNIEGFPLEKYNRIVLYLLAQ